MAREKSTKSNLIEFPGAGKLEDELELLEDTGEEGEGGDEGGEGTTAPLIDPALFGLDNTFFLEIIRQAERQFSNGWVPVTKEPRKNNEGGGLGYEGPPPHPLINKSSRFNSDPPNLSANPQNNEKAKENYQELRPNLVPTPTPTPQHVAQPGSSAPRPKPGGF